MKIRIRMLILMTAAFLAGCTKPSQVLEEVPTCRITHMTVNNSEDPIGVEGELFFSWRLEDSEPEQLQTAYRIVVGESENAVLAEDYIWDSGKIESGLSVAIPYEGEQKAGSCYYWRVFAWDKSGEMLQSKLSRFEIGMPDEEWSAEWIGLPNKAADLLCDTSYTILFDLKLESKLAGFLWGAKEGRYGDYCLWTIDTTAEYPRLLLAEKRYNKTFSETALALDGALGNSEQFVQAVHRVRIEVLEGIRVDTWIDGYYIGQIEFNVSKELGGIGFWVERGTEYAWFDNLSVTNAEGDILYEEDFSKETTIFSPYYIHTENGWGRAASGWVVTPGGEQPAPMLRKSFLTEQDEIVSARLYASAFGIYDITLNGNAVGDAYFAPGESLYSKEVYYQTYDVTDYIQAGENAIGVMLGHGKYDRAGSDFGNELLFCAQLVITYADGSRQIIITDDSWSGYGDGPVRNDDIYSGEYYDFNREIQGWTEPDFAAEGWENAVVYQVASQIKRTAILPNQVECVMELTPVSVSEPQPGVFVYDFGQNFNGTVRIALTGSPEQAVTLRYAETLNEETMSCQDDGVGTVWTQNLCTADNTDYIILSGNGEEICELSFVCRGFRYLQITGIEEALPLEDIQGLVLSSVTDRTGYFVCSDERINRIYESIYWSQLGNYVDLPMDCPQRDERLGWAGDAQVFAGTAVYNADIYNFLERYVDMLRQGQDENGAYPEIAVFSGGYGSNGWADAGVILVWELYEQYGNIGIVEENFDAMCRYVEYLEAVSEDYLRGMGGYNDHCAISSPSDTYTNTSQCAYVAELMVKMSLVVGDEEAYAKYSEISSRFKTAWQEAFLNEDGSIGEWMQSEYVMGLAFDLYPDEDLAVSGAQKLLVSVQASDYHPATGYITTPHLLPILSRYGYTDAAYRLLQQETYPSWLYMLSHGGTTTTESWFTYQDAEDGSYSINASLNHVALGSVGEWLYSGILGIVRDETAPGFKHFFLEPQVGGGLTYAEGSYECAYGTIVSEWHVMEDEIVFYFEIPTNTSATITLPDPAYQQMEVGSGTWEYRIELTDFTEYNNS